MNFCQYTIRKAKKFCSLSVVSTSCTEQKNKKKTIFTSPVKVTMVDSSQEVKFEVPFFAGLISWCINFPASTSLWSKETSNCFEDLQSRQFSAWLIKVFYKDWENNLMTSPWSYGRINIPLEIDAINGGELLCTIHAG